MLRHQHCRGNSIASPLRDKRDAVVPRAYRIRGADVYIVPLHGNGLARGYGQWACDRGGNQINR